MINVTGLKVVYGTGETSLTAIEGVNLDISRGEICSVIGSSGCGKTTLLYTLSGLVQSTAGKVLVDKKPVKAKRLKTSLILQNYGLLPWKTVFENICIGLRIRKTFNKEKNELVENLITRMGLEKFRNYFPEQLSGGQRQRVAIARALAVEPDLLLMDEPFSALDAITRERLQELLLELWLERPITIVIVTHSIEEAVYLGQKIAVFSPGPAGKINSLIRNPYFGDLNLRQRPEFYHLCAKLRRSLEVVSSGKENAKQAVN